MPKTGRPRLPDSERRSQMIGIALRPVAYERVRIIAERENRSMSAVAREAVENYWKGMDDG